MQRIALGQRQRLTNSGRLLTIEPESRRVRPAVFVRVDANNYRDMVYGERVSALAAFCDTFMAADWYQQVASDLQKKNVEVYSAYFAEPIPETRAVQRTYAGFFAVQMQGPDYLPKLEYLCVNGAFRGEGIGRLLLDTFEQLLRVLHQTPEPFVVHVNAFNHGNAREFYVKNGYRYESLADELTRQFTAAEAEAMRAEREVSKEARALPVTVTVYKILAPITVPPSLLLR